MAAVQVVEGVHVPGEVLLELLPGDVDHLVGDVALHHLDEVLHLVTEQL